MALERLIMTRLHMAQENGNIEQELAVIKELQALKETVLGGLPDFTVEEGISVLREQADSAQYEPDSRTFITLEGKRKILSITENTLLQYLSANQDEVLSYPAILDGMGISGNKQRLYTIIKRLRAKIENDPKRPEHIVTVGGRGYLAKKIIVAPPQL